MYTLAYSAGQQKTYSQPQVTPDYCLSREELMQRAHAGDASAQFLVGRAMRIGDLGFKINKDEGTKWIETASRNGNGPAALCARGYCFEAGIGGVVIENKERAKFFYSQAKNQGYIPATYELATTLYAESFTQTVSIGTVAGYYQSTTNISVNKEQLADAVNLLAACSEAGYGPSFTSLGTCYYGGHGVKENKVKGLSIYRLAADKGSAQAKMHIGDIYYQGYGIEKNKKEAKKWYRAAAEQGLEINPKFIKSKKCVVM